MTAVSLLCDQCSNAITGDPHWPHSLHCGGTTDPSCTCSNIVCLGCCRDCTPSSGPLLLDESDAPAVRGVPAGANSGDGSSRAGLPTGDAAPDTTAASPSPDTSDGGSGSARPPTGSAISQSPTEDRVVDLMAALEQSVAAAKAARDAHQSQTENAPVAAEPAPGR